MKIITITTYKSMPDRFRVDCEFSNGKRGFGRDASNAGEAAALAMNYAFDGGGDYVIVGHTDALSQIPVDLRVKR